MYVLLMDFIMDFSAISCMSDYTISDQIIIYLKINAYHRCLYMPRIDAIDLLRIRMFLLINLTSNDACNLFFP